MKKVKNLIIVSLLLCTLGLTGCSTYTNDLVNSSMPFSAVVLSYVSISNGTAIKNINKTDNQLSVVYDNGDVLTYSTAVKMGNPSLSFSMNYVSSEKKREGSKSEKYYVTGINKKKDEERTFTVSFDLWNKINTDTTIKVKVSLNHITELEE